MKPPPSAFPSAGFVLEKEALSTRQSPHHSDPLACALLSRQTSASPSQQARTMRMRSIALFPLTAAVMCAILLLQFNAAFSGDDVGGGSGSLLGQRNNDVPLVTYPHQTLPLVKTAAAAKAAVLPPLNSRTNDTFSACLLVMDDNHRLPEWIAYHYTALNLRHLIVLSDPTSTTSPTSILNPWRSHLTIEEWTDDAYMDEGLAKRAAQVYNNKNETGDYAVRRHQLLIERQSKFLQHCAIHLKALGKTWVSFHDIDEFYIVNGKVIPNAAAIMAEPGSVLNVLNQVQSHLEPLAELTSWKLPNQQFVGSCVTTHRVPYGAVESTAVEQAAGVPSFINPAQFETLRWRHHQGFQAGKSLLDVSRVADLKQAAWPGRERHPFSPHRLIPSCPVLRYNEQAAIVLNHYLGTWENYSSRGRQDSRKRRKAWSAQALRRGGVSGDDIRPWIQAFVALVGEAEVKRLLAHVGIASETAPFNNDTRVL